ncbi:DNA mismatch repair protein MutS2 [Alteribacillus persepolensis]|uniref:Endonuclease MutS2 n=1 Tax=Alteribacillus persepolensis TaxID=568899 RepID=A0A1G8BMU6_9BACI|nr:endonuclease MutS2 [Alteribacillus persepolensis]SDH34414.1 DNA mismatch repair protein MutS2 [Alteribacillus persepolensis]
MNARVRRVLEYDKMKEQLKAHAASSLGRQKIDALTPYTDLAAAKKEQERTYEGTKVLRLKGQAPLGGIRSIYAHVKRAQIGGMLHPDELMEVADTIYASRRLKSFIETMVEEEVELPLLLELVREIVPLTDLERAIKQCIDDHGEVMDGASPALRSVRQQIRTSEAEVRSKLEQLIRSSGQQKKLSDAIVTIRNDRYVIPVKQEYRTSFGGIVHDQSSSGATLFIEPQSVVQMNNKLREARVKERQEVERILQELSAHVQEHTDELVQNSDYLAELDFLFCKAYYAKAIDAVQPRLNDEGRFRFKQARHPLISQEEVVPIDVELGDDFSSLVITGPNTGGKTVTLKTAGLLTMMAQSGLFLPVDEDSEAAVFTDVFADIGDEQSIEQNLSTFSSHMTNIVDILQHINHTSLVLFDEIGAGTDPTEGAALAVSILDYVYQTGAKLIATTHYSELKGYAYNREGVMNASVEFDVDTLSPTYRLLIGVPGRSNAFAISRRLGLDENIIQNAEKEIDAENRQVEKMITSLDEKRRDAEQEMTEAAQIREQAEELHKELEQRIQAWNNQKEKLMKEAEEKAEAEVKKAQQKAEDIIRDLRDLQKEGYHVKEHQFIDAKKGLDEAAPKLTKRQKQIKKQAQKAQSFSPGDEVRVLSFGQKGQVLEKVNNKEYQVQLGIMKVNVKAEDMEKVKAEPVKQPSRPVTTVSRNTHVKPELDLRGMRYEEAMHKVEKYLDDAVLAGYPQVHIIHGKGTGALRKGVKELLKKHPSVNQTRDGGMNEGGMGNTVVQLK